MSVDHVRRTTRQGYPILRLNWNDQPITIGADLKRSLLDQGVVFLGPEFEDSARVRLAARPDLGQPATELLGFTDDPELIAIVREWISELDS